MKFSPKCKTKKFDKDIHNFGKFLLIFELGMGPVLAPNQI